MLLGPDREVVPRCHVQSYFARQRSLYLFGDVFESRLGHSCVETAVKARRMADN